MMDLLASERQAAQRLLEARRSQFEQPTALDSFFIAEARRTAASQPRCDYTIGQLPVLGNVVSTDLVPVFHNGQTYGVQANVLSSVSPIPSSVFNVKAYGAKGDGATDDTVAIQAAITAAQNAGGGIVYLPAAKYKISSILTVSTGYVGLAGDGKNATQIVMATSGTSAVQFTGGGTILTAIHNNFIRDLGIWQNAPTATSCVGLSLYYTAGATVSNVQISGFLIGMQLQRATNTLTTNTETSFNSSAPINNAIGFNLIGNTPGSDNNGNASSIFRDCFFDASAASGGYVNVSPNSIGFKLYGTYVADYVFDNCNTNYAYYGWSIDFTTATSNGGTNGDIEIINPVIDLYTNQAIIIGGISAATTDNLSMVSVIGGWIDPYSGAASPSGVYVTNGKGVSVTGTQFMTSTPSGAANQVGISINSSSDVTVAGCQFVGQKNGVVCSSSTDCQVIGNRFWNSTGSHATLFVNCVGCTRIGVSNNVFDGYCNNTAIQFDGTTTLSVASGNTINTANIASPYITNSGTGNKIASNMGYNPVGKFGSQPAVPATTVAYTNNFGPDASAFITAGASTCAVSIGGQSAFTIAASGVAMVRVPAGQTITLTYTNAPTWVWFGD